MPATIPACYRHLTGVKKMSDFSVPQLEQFVQECLSQLYDFSFLQNHPLVDLLIHNSKSPNRIQSFRSLIIDTIESIRTDPELVPDQKSERFYNILNLRYVKKHSVQRSLSILTVSERQFYRDHAKAIQIVTSMLSEQLRGERAIGLSMEKEDAGSVASEVQRTRIESKQTRTDFKDVIQGILGAVQTLLNENNISIETVISNQIAILDSDRTVMRQIILLILSELAMNVPDSQITIHCEAVDSRFRTSFRLLPRDNKTRIPEIFSQIEQLESLQELVQSIQGEITITLSDTVLDMSLEIPQHHETILVIDDNPNIINLFQRYASNLPYQVVGADAYETAIRFARSFQPKMIILDVMLPGQDGWEILQNLKSHPKTSTIPVLVCSVLHVAGLALSLGADSFLKKPPGQAEFIQLLQQH